MKTNTFLLITVISLFFCQSVFSQLKVDSMGKVGINNTAPTYRLDLNGSARFITGTTYGSVGILFEAYYSQGILDPLTDGGGMLGYNNKWSQAFINSIWTAGQITYSDRKFKENIKQIPDALQTITKLNGVKYDLKPDYFGGTDAESKQHGGINLPLKNRMGFIAQEMAAVLPDLVIYDSVKQVHGIIYENLIPVLVEAMKEQQGLILELKDKIESIETHCFNNDLKSASIIPSGNSAEKIARLDQNIPNPFSSETRIGCFIPEGSVTSVLYIYNMNGTQLQQYIINGQGKQSVTINGNSFDPGMYLYALVIDGKEVDTKRMILTK
ncbi:MAG TPA: tail fiber domain-containing protein [Prolixibacteraceae bacterium]|nr:tail fiber domain-containing protein [Prolixibacteraceae bacterium]